MIFIQEHSNICVLHYNFHMPNALIVGIDSELGKSIGFHLRDSGWSVYGTTRRKELVSESIFYLEASNSDTINHSTDSFMQIASDWDLLIIAIGMLNPIGKITEVDFSQWRNSFNVNFVNQLFLIRIMLEKSASLPKRNRKVLTFAGGGTNSAPENFSAYTLSKIALIKATEILAAEYPFFTFLSLGTGWMKSAIHEQTLLAGKNAGLAFEETKRRLENDDFGDSSKLLQFLDWYISCTDQEITGRNIALQGDDWESPDFAKQLTSSKDSFKLRRSQ